MLRDSGGHAHGETDRTLLSPERRRTDRAALADGVVDVLVIGGGVTGAGAALDAASRGLSVALVEARDWAAGTSSRSSKLIHGGCATSSSSPSRWSGKRWPSGPGWSRRSPRTW
ncbi:FAD-dependent oxidoreductase [Blastococcus brunescens]|uniref:Glycerol-3-phosphate dehydrogenase n=1 Tax=Blastococcus brunescens TaxID=1564165 RepID=A0ABZ1AY85_9ACTN|nr:FAD-dependent oxidoreductase [Blastococcus sp. BMG 8361]WRL62886.1 FAD-dependent oxidoreductase [Blastococcus sp. BMG 8361]